MGQHEENACIRLIILERSALETLYGGQFTLKTIYAVILPADAVPQFFLRNSTFLFV